MNLRNIIDCNYVFDKNVYLVVLEWIVRKIVFYNIMEECVDRNVYVVINVIKLRDVEMLWVRIVMEKNILINKIKNNNI